MPEQIFYPTHCKGAATQTKPQAPSLRTFCEFGMLPLSKSNSKSPLKLTSCTIRNNLYAEPSNTSFQVQPGNQKQESPALVEIGTRYHLKLTSCTILNKRLGINSQAHKQSLINQIG